MNKILERFVIYTSTPLETLGWKHSAGWGLALGFVWGMVAGIVFHILWIAK